LILAPQPTTVFPRAVGVQSLRKSIKKSMNYV
jgi:hypothetical protein